MLNIFKKFFTKKQESQETDFTASVFELWSTDFSKDDNKRFLEESGDGYKTFFDKGYNLELYRKELFAWSTNPQYQYKNLCIETALDFSKINILVPETQSEIAFQNGTNSSNIKSAGFCAFGIMFRCVNDSNFYMLLISDKGQFRFDVVFNGTQIPLLGWTKIPENKNKKQSKDLVPLQIIANGTNFSIIINNQYVTTIQDDTIQSEGYISFAGQNWTEHEKVCCTLPYFVIESRQVQTDASSQQWNSENFIDENHHIEISKSLSAVGRNIPALIELKKIPKEKINEEIILLKARINMALQLYPEAISELKTQLEKNPESLSLIEELASCFYLSSQYNEFDTFFETVLEQTNASALLCSLKAHICTLQRNFDSALDWYEKAFSLQNEEGTHLLNIASTLKLKNQNKEAIEKLLQACQLFLDKKNYQLFVDTTFELEKEKLSAKQKMELHSLRGKFYWYQNQFDKAKEELEFYISSKSTKKTDHQAIFMLSTIYKDDNDLENALELCEKAINLSEKESLYFRTKAEILLELEKIEEAKSLFEKATELNEDDGWAWYYLAKINLNSGDIKTAKSNICSASTILSEELAVLNLYTIILKSENRLEEALNLIESNAKHSGRGIDYRRDAYHLIANFLKDDNQFEKAESFYEKSLELSPRDELLITDYADLCVKNEKISQAENLLARLFMTEPSPKASRIMACIATKKGDYYRAELALRQGIENSTQANEDYILLKIDLANLYLLTNKTFLSQEIAKELEPFYENPLVKEFLENLNEKTMRKLSCCKCSENWFVPKNLTEGAKLTLKAMPPDNLPAGICPECGKVFCIGCAKEKLQDDGRFVCLDCGVNLKLQDSGIVYLLNQWSSKK
ncbi:MAG: tetratricopeptide repeat protein [Treponemataceae bacterium]|nr:tetratricopeptide repeat protein [Treponemataceae bacterium]